MEPPKTYCKRSGGPDPYSVTKVGRENGNIIPYCNNQTWGLFCFFLLLPTGAHAHTHTQKKKKKNFHICRRCVFNFVFVSLSLPTNHHRHNHPSHTQHATYTIPAFVPAACLF
uniref:Uncharacterized protein n=1 Tax=Palpitomonas bilix TaxID=652834 RepID=A0A7S3CV60_9EUKA